MEVDFFFLLALIGSLAALNLGHAQDQKGFISLDCGLVPEDRTYTHRSTGIKYESDANFIETGESKLVQPQYQDLLTEQTLFLRSFPQGNRNCYNLILKKNQKYLIRGTFLYGNYDDLHKLPGFDLYIGPNKWTSVIIQAVANVTFFELIHVLNSDNLQVCLVKTGSTVPFISSLEIRPLKSNSYVTQSGSLNTRVRQYISPNPRIVRFDDDADDRWWETHYDNGLTALSTEAKINTSGSYNPPQLIMRTAGIPKNSSQPLGLLWIRIESSVDSYIYLHFAEIEKLKANETREFNITYNGGKMFRSNFRPSRLRLTTFYNREALKFDENGETTFVLVKTERSTHPPLINAFEVYTVVELPNVTTDKNDVDAIASIKKMYKLNRNSWQGDPCSPKEYLWEGLDCSYKDSESPRITSLNLSSSGLTGDVATYIQNLTQLQVLDLSNNSLTGELPEFLAKMISLKIINLRSNNLNGSVPASLASKINDGSLDIHGNQIVCPADLCKSNKPKKNKYIVPVVATVAPLATIITALAILFIFIRRKERDTKDWALSVVPKDRQYKYSDIIRMTKGFQRVLGQGGFGQVYHGYLNDTVEVAVKLLSYMSAQGYKQFKAEVELLLRVHHRNLVILVGYCEDGGHLALIYEYMRNGTLREHLSGKRGSHVLSWATRLQIAIDAAEGLEYLHNGCKPSMVHRDVKTTNILLNERFRAKLADFGLSRSFPAESKSLVATDPAGTPGYVDPEYYRTNLLSEKSDVYSFGIVLLEIITNQAVIDHSREKTHITEWVRMVLAGGDITKIVDRRLEEHFDTDGAWRVLELAMSCVEWSSNRRPKMPQVVTGLNECLAAENARIEREMMYSRDATLSFEDDSILGPR